MKVLFSHTSTFVSCIFRLIDFDVVARNDSIRKSLFNIYLFLFIDVFNFHLQCTDSPVYSNAWFTVVGLIHRYLLQYMSFIHKTHLVSLSQMEKHKWYFWADSVEIKPIKSIHVDVKTNMYKMMKNVKFCISWQQ